MDRSTLQEIEIIVRTVLGKPDLVLEQPTRLVDIGGWDSMTHMDIIHRVELHYNFQIGLDDVLSLEKIGDLVSLVDKRNRV